MDPKAPHVLTGITPSSKGVVSCCHDCGMTGNNSHKAGDDAKCPVRLIKRNKLDTTGYGARQPPNGKGVVWRMRGNQVYGASKEYEDFCAEFAKMATGATKGDGAPKVATGTARC